MYCFAWSQSVDPETEKSTITKLIDDETRYAAAADLTSQKKCWVDDEAMFTIASAEDAQQFQGWNVIESLMNSAEPSELKLKRDNYQYTIQCRLLKRFFITSPQSSPKGEEVSGT